MKGTDKKFKFSRTRWTKPRVAAEHQIVEQLFEIGCAIIHPQELSLEQQLSVVCGAETLIGPQGTALHWSLYYKDIKNAVYRGWSSPLQKGICMARGQTYRVLKGSRPKGAHLRVRSVPMQILQTIVRDLAG